jgi:GDP-4-dehydro-6-deoxy-D-mannose reductase
VAKILVLGSEGFSARHFLDFCRRDHPEHAVLRVDRAAAGRPGPAPYLSLDLRDRARVFRLIREERPDAIFNFAGLVHSDDLADLVDANVLVVDRLLAAVAELKGYAPRILLIGSAAEFGVPRAPDGMIRERDRKKPVTNYGLSKVFLDKLVEKALPSSRALIFRAKPFNLIGSHQSERLIVGALVAQIRRIRDGEQPPELCVGNLDAERDFIDIRDLIAAYWKMIWSPHAGEVFVIGSGRAVRIRRLVEILVRLAGLKVEIVPRPELKKAQDPPRIYADPTSIMTKLHWRPRISLERSLRDALWAGFEEDAAPPESAPRTP